MAMLPCRPALWFYFWWFIFYCLMLWIHCSASSTTAMLRGKRKNKTGKSWSFSTSTRLKVSNSLGIYPISSQIYNGAICYFVTSRIGSGVCLMICAEKGFSVSPISKFDYAGLVISFRNLHNQQREILKLVNLITHFLSKKEGGFVFVTKFKEARVRDSGSKLQSERWET